jgi:hypothetical protein
MQLLSCVASGLFKTLHLYYHMVMCILKTKAVNNICWFVPLYCHLSKVQLGPHQAEHAEKPNGIITWQDCDEYHCSFYSVVTCEHTWLSTVIFLLENKGGMKYFTVWMCVWELNIFIYVMEKMCVSSYSGFCIKLEHFQVIHMVWLNCRVHIFYNIKPF